MSYWTRSEISIYLYQKHKLIPEHYFLVYANLILNGAQSPLRETLLGRGVVSSQIITLDPKYGLMQNEPALQEQMMVQAENRGNKRIKTKRLYLVI